MRILVCIALMFSACSAEDQDPAEDRDVFQQDRDRNVKREACGAPLPPTEKEPVELAEVLGNSDGNFKLIALDFWTEGESLDPSGEMSRVWFAVDVSPEGEEEDAEAVVTSRLQCEHHATGDSGHAHSIETSMSFPQGFRARDGRLHRSWVEARFSAFSDVDRNDEYRTRIQSPADRIEQTMDQFLSGFAADHRAYSNEYGDLLLYWELEWEDGRSFGRQVVRLYYMKTESGVKDTRRSPGRHLLPAATGQ